jgi:hypothetical protein
MSFDKRVWHTYSTYRGWDGRLYSEQILHRNGKVQRRVLVSLTRKVWVKPHEFFGNETAAWYKAKNGGENQGNLSSAQTDYNRRSDY